MRTKQQKGAAVPMAEGCGCADTMGGKAQQAGESNGISYQMANEGMVGWADPSERGMPRA